MAKNDILGVDPVTGKLLYREDLKHFTGSAPTGHEAEVTPTIRETIRDVDSALWVDNEIPVSDLQDQLAILESRRIIAYQTGNTVIVNYLEAGIARLQMILKQRAGDDLTLI